MNKKREYYRLYILYIKPHISYKRDLKMTFNTYEEFIGWATTIQTCVIKPPKNKEPYVAIEIIQYIKDNDNWSVNPLLITPIDINKLNEKIKGGF